MTHDSDPLTEYGKRLDDLTNAISESLVRSSLALCELDEIIVSFGVPVKVFEARIWGGDSQKPYSGGEEVE